MSYAFPYPVTCLVHYRVRFAAYSTVGAEGITLTVKSTKFWT